MLEKIKLLLGINDTSKDSLINLLIEQATDELKTLTHRTNVEGLDNIVERMVVYRYNSLGTEGVSAESYSGVSFSYSVEYPDEIKRMIYARRKIGVV